MPYTRVSPYSRTLFEHHCILTKRSVQVPRAFQVRSLSQEITLRPASRLLREKPAYGYMPPALIAIEWGGFHYSGIS